MSDIGFYLSITEAEVIAEALGDVPVAGNSVGGISDNSLYAAALLYRLQGQIEQAKAKE